MTQYPPLSRDPAEQPTVIVPDMPVSGRSTPRPAPLPADFRHDVRFRRSARSGITAYCEPCDWTTWVADGHDVTDLIRLVNMHEGITTPAAAPVHVDVASDLPPGSRCVKCGATEGIWRLSHPVTHVMGTWCREVLPCEQRVTARQATA